MAQMQVFVSHSHKDDEFCRAIVEGLRGAGADVWYDEHNMGSGRLGPTIERELRRRPVFIVVLSPAALASEWVEDEARWAYGLYRKDRSRTLQPITARALTEDDIWLFLQDFKRIEAAGLQPYPTEEAVRRLLRMLALTPADAVAAPATPQLTESVTDLVDRGKSLNSQNRYAEALPLFERVTQLDMHSFDAWANLSWALTKLHRDTEAVTARERALSLNGNSASQWRSEGANLMHRELYEEALTAYDRALALDPTSDVAWNMKGYLLGKLKRHEEALVAHERAVEVAPNSSSNWNYMGRALRNLGRYDEALAAADRERALFPIGGWSSMGHTLSRLKRYDEALDAYDRSLTLNSHSPFSWSDKGVMLCNLKRYDEALDAFDHSLTRSTYRSHVWWDNLRYKAFALIKLNRHKEALAALDEALAFDPNDAATWNSKAEALRCLNRPAEADAAERRAKELGG